MLIAIPVNAQLIESGVCVSFGRAPYFLIYDTVSGKTSFIANSAAKEQGGAGIKAAQIIVDSQVTALLTPRCGENAAKVISAAKITMYRTLQGSIKDNISAFEKNQLPLLTQIHSGFHGHNGG